MEILFKGTPPGEQQYEGHCTTCLTRVRFKRSEATESNDQRDPGVYVKCPVCKHGNIVGRQIHTPQDQGHRQSANRGDS